MSRREGRARRLPPAERRAQLLACAIRVFARRGIGAARHADVAREAGVSVPAVFSYFETRPALVEAVLSEVARLYLELAQRVHAQERPAPETILAHAQAFAESVAAHPDHARVWLEWSSAVGAETWALYQPFEERVVALLARTLARGQREGSIDRELAPEDGARIAIGSGHMIAQLKLSGREPEVVERFERSMVRALAGGILSADTAA
jgi:TetR/AcrR family hemagglutinin/protease transcriptional regulator